jgi:hypothetical protein
LLALIVLRVRVSTRLFAGEMDVTQRHFEYGTAWMLRYIRSGVELPFGGDPMPGFLAYCRREWNYADVALVAEDGWGTPLWWQWASRSRGRLCSAGADKRPGTSDDVFGEWVVLP